MSDPVSLVARRLGLAALVVATVFGLESLDGVTDAQAAPPDDLLVLAMSVETDEGRVVGSPVVVGASGQRVEVRLVCEKNPAKEKMSVVLDPLESTDDGTIRYSYSLSVAGRMSHERGTVELTPGEERRIEVKPANGKRRGVTFALYAAPVNQAGVGKYLRDRKQRLGVRAI